MKFWYRLCASATVCMIFMCYFRVHVKAMYQQFIGNMPRHIIIFGDESASLALSDSISFTARLCGDIKARCEDYAPRVPTATGTLINSLLVGGSGRHDLSVQLALWLNGFKAIQKRIPQNTLFMFFFGINDFWKFCTRQEELASAALMDSLDTLFDKIEEVTREVEQPVEILVPKIVDITMFPGWRKFGTHKVLNGRGLTKIHRTMKVYNKELERRIKRWNKAKNKKGKIITWDADSLVLKTLRGGITAEAKILETAMKTGDADFCRTVGAEDCNPEIRGPDWGTVFGSPEVHKLMVADIISTIRESRLAEKNSNSEPEFSQFEDSVSN